MLSLRLFPHGALGGWVFLNSRVNLLYVWVLALLNTLSGKMSLQLSVNRWR